MHILYLYTCMHILYLYTCMHILYLSVEKNENFLGRYRPFESASLWSVSAHRSGRGSSWPTVPGFGKPSPRIPSAPLKSGESHEYSSPNGAVPWISPTCEVWCCVNEKQRVMDEGDYECTGHCTYGKCTLRSSQTSESSQENYDSVHVQSIKVIYWSGHAYDVFAEAYPNLIHAIESLQYCAICIAQVESFGWICREGRRGRYLGRKEQVLCKTVQQHVHIDIHDWANVESWFCSSWHLPHALSIFYTHQKMPGLVGPVGGVKKRFKPGYIPMRDHYACKQQ